MIKKVVQPSCFETLNKVLKLDVQEQLQLFHQHLLQNSLEFYKMLRILSSKILFLIFLTTCLGGCSYQIFLLSKQYFTYMTSSRVESPMRFKQKFSGFMICVPFNELSHVDSKNLTIAQMLNFTPPAEDILLSCKFRLKHNNKMQIFDRENCLKYFDVEKYCFGISICYQYNPKRDLSFTITNVANAMTHPLIVYILTLSKEIMNASSLSVAAHLINTLNFPTNSMKFLETIKKFSVDNIVFFRTTRDDYHLLPPPYDTQCSDFSDSNQNGLGCYASCIQSSSITHLNRFPLAQATTKPLNLLPLTYSDLNENSTAKLWNNIDNECKYKCRFPSCAFSITSTDIKQSYVANTKDVLMVIASVPYAADFGMIAVASLPGIEYFSGLCSTVGTWFGFSIISMRPEKLHQATRHLKFSWRHILKPKRKLQKYVNFLYILGCFVGYMLHTYQVCNAYFSYSTISKVERVEAKDASYYNLPSLSLCFPVLDVIQRSKYQEFGIMATSEEGRAMYEEELSKLTVRHLLKLTPDPIDVVASCDFRQDFSMLNFEKEHCIQRLNIIKGISGGHVCYIATPATNDTYVFKNVMTSLTNQKQIYNLHLNPRVNKAQYVIAVAYDYEHIHSRLPSISRNYGSRIALFDKSKEKQDNYVSVLNKWIEIRRLPSPYDTNCVSSTNAYSCFRECLFKEYKNISRVPFSEIVTNPNTDFKILSLKDMRNETMKKIVKETEHYCEDKCSHKPCFQSVTFTDNHHFHHFSIKTVMFTLMSEGSPTYEITSNPFMTTTEFIQFLCNPIGIWFGFSIISLHPKNLKNFYKQYSLSRV